MKLQSRLTHMVLIGLIIISTEACSLHSASKDSSSQTSLINSQRNQQQHNFAKVPFEQQAQQMIALIWDEKFPQVESLMAQLIDDQLSTRGGFYYPDAVLQTVFTTAPPATYRLLREKLNQWVARDPESVLALVVRSQFYRDRAWDARGEKLISKTPQPAREEYTRLIKLCLEDLEAAQNLNPDHPLLLLAILRVGSETGMSRQVFESYFDAITDQIPFLPQAYHSKERYLEPQWQGSEAELLSFVREASAAAPKGSVVPLIVSQAHRANELFHRYPDRREYLNRVNVWADIEQSLTRVIEDFPKAGLYPALYAELAYFADKDDIAQTYIKIALEREPNHPEIQRIKSKIDKL